MIDIRTKVTARYHYNTISSILETFPTKLTKEVTDITLTFIVTILCSSKIYLPKLMDVNYETSHAQNKPAGI